MDARREWVVLLGLALVGAGVFGWFFPEFPTATVPVEYSESKAPEIAAEFLHQQGYDVSDYRHNTSFYVDDSTSTYIQRRLPWRRAKDAMLEYNVYAWETAYFHSDRNDEFYVDVDPVDGEVIYFQRVLPENASGARLPGAAARDRAEQFLVAQGHDVDGLELVKQSSTDLPNRRDHTFVWEARDRGVAGAAYRVEVDVQGDRIGYYEEYLNIPDGFYDSYLDRQLRDQLLLGAGFLLLSALLFVAAVVYGLRFYKAGTFDTRFALGLGAVVAVLSVVNAINTLPGILEFLPVGMDAWPIVVAVVIGSVIAAIVFGGITAVFAGAGKQLARRVLDYHPVDRLSELRYDADTRRRVSLGLIRGFLLTAVILGVYTLFYLIGTTYFDVWLPADTPLLTAISTYVPAVLALTLAGIAAISEETTYRLFAIPFGTRVLGYPSLAVLGSAVIWGLGHSGYAVEPAYARVIEVTIIGVILGVAFLRYGLLATVGAHFSLNALAVGVPLLLAETTDLVVQGLLAMLVAVVPLLLAGGLYVSTRGRWAPRRVS